MWEVVLFLDYGTVWILNHENMHGGEKLFYLASYTREIKSFACIYLPSARDLRWRKWIILQRVCMLELFSTSTGQGRCCLSGFEDG